MERLTRVAGEEGVALRLDVTDEASVRDFVREVSKRFGRIDVLVNNAGGALGLNPLKTRSTTSGSRCGRRTFWG